ncbi:short chain enoyl-CoA hydratase /3-hydroxyacyl-CoA dehydrogenase [Fodinibius salinus]|uniref:enoyl-CoA hydratase n=1 Tax=Fodinibius salinus TaxID=860790 RepID=A0A5D3YIH7_9BACT|nr:3-hydroxyacyl-CoA dehydrogenase NAD-binding domain-containing protein [Fodinibius salinus]TYP93365.1 short chain enoyl-CoA hydratase /3-hydroxyacyl-CoA dehydrogenase [Fodinibius salinus]
MSYLSIEEQENILVVTLNQPDEKVNKLNEALISDFENLLNDVNDNEIDGIVLQSGKEGNFIAGADVEMLKNKSAPEGIEELSRRGNELLLKLEKHPIPVVAAIHGSCIGGGMEVAMACNYRVASEHSDTVMGQPEVNLGLLPGGGGTQRLPRLIGIQNALTYMLTGKNIYPRKAYKLGLVDELTHKDAVLTAAKAAVKKINSGKFERKDKRSLAHQLMEGLSPLRKIIYSQARKRAQSNTKGNYPAPEKIIDSVEEGYENGFQAGLELESVNFGKLAATPESEALVNMFFAMQGAKKNPQEDQAKGIQKMGVLGAGLMGSGIADVSVNNDFRVLLKDQSVEQASKGKQSIWKSLEKNRKKHIISSFERDRISSLVTPTETYDGFENTDMVIEAVFEDLDLKQSILEEVEQVTPDHCIFASNTSSLPINNIAEASGRPEQVVGMHYFSPVPKMPLLEIITTEKTADWVTATAREVGIQQGKHVIVVNDGPGFYTTRILSPFMNEALMLLEEGISIKQLDHDMKQFGFPVGPAALFDEVGIDVAAHITEVLSDLFAERGIQSSQKPTELFEEGYKGRKNQKGFYTYEEKDGDLKKGDPNKQMYQYFGGPNRTSMDANTVQQRMTLTMVNEAAWCLQEDILHNATDGDLGAVMGLGFPPFLGGPFRYIDREGADKIVQRLEKFEQEHGPRFTPADILKDYAKSGKKFHQD